MISTGVASSVVGGELWIPLPGDGSSQIKVFLQEPLTAFGDGHGRIAHTRLLFARAKSAITGELPAIMKARNAAHESLNRGGDNAADALDLFQRMVGVPPVIQRRDRFFQPLHFLFG